MVNGIEISYPEDAVAQTAVNKLRLTRDNQPENCAQNLGVSLIDWLGALCHQHAEDFLRVINNQRQVPLAWVNSIIAIG